MKVYMNNFGVWEIVINPPTPSTKKGKAAAQREAKKDNATILKFLMDGLPSSVKESVGEYISSNDLQFILESEYQNGRPDNEKINYELEDKPPKQINQELDSIKVMDSFYCNDNICDEIGNVLSEDDEYISKAAQEIHLTLINIDLR